jgi:hypothetical protein
MVSHSSEVLISPLFVSTFSSSVPSFFSSSTFCSSAGAVVPDVAAAAAFLTRLAFRL